MGDYKRLSSAEMRENHIKKAKQKYQKRKSSVSILKKVFHYARDYRWYLYAAMLLDIVNTICVVMVPVYTGYCINNIVSAGNVNFTSLYTNMLYLGIFAVGAAVSTFLAEVS